MSVIHVRDVFNPRETLHSLRQAQGRNGQERHVLELLRGEAVGEPPARVGMDGIVKGNRLGGPLSPCPTSVWTPDHCYLAQSQDE